MNVEPKRMAVEDGSGLHSPQLTSPVHEALNHNHRSFNTTNNHYHFSCGYRHSFTPTLDSVASEDSLTEIIEGISLQSHSHVSSSNGITQVEGKDTYEQATRTPVTSDFNTGNSFLQESTSPDGVTVEDKNVHEHGMIVLQSKARPPRQSASQVSHFGSMKGRFLTPVSNLSARIKRGSRKILWPFFQPTSPESLNLWTEINFKGVNDYLPHGIGEKYRNYMRSLHLPQENAIPLWNPSPIQEVNVPRRKRIDVGDVGTFTRRGGFRVAFNILLSEKTNKLCGYDVPKNFFQFRPSLTPSQEKTCSIKDDGPVIDLDGCGAIIPERVGDIPDVLSHGFQQRLCKSKEPPFATGCKISPEANSGKARGYILLPHGAKIHSFSSKASKELTAYLNDGLNDWLEYLEGLWHRGKAPPIILTSVWVARSFAYATYTGHPLKTSAFAQVWTSTKGDKIYWGQSSEGFETARAPLDDGYDGNDILKSQEEDQCFAIEGYVVKSRMEVSKMRASQAEDI